MSDLARSASSRSADALFFGLRELTDDRRRAGLIRLLFLRKERVELMPFLGLGEEGAEVAVPAHEGQRGSDAGALRLTGSTLQRARKR